MTTEYKLNTYIKWTDEDRAKGKCPVPMGSDVTLWFIDDTCRRITDPTTWDWSDGPIFDDGVITAYLIHSVPREPIVLWAVVGGTHDGLCYPRRDIALLDAAAYGGRVVKMVEEAKFLRTTLAELKGQDDE